MDHPYFVRVVKFVVECFIRCMMWSSTVLLLVYCQHPSLQGCRYFLCSLLRRLRPRLHPFRPIRSLILRQVLAHLLQQPSFLYQLCHRTGLLFLWHPPHIGLHTFYAKTATYDSKTQIINSCFAGACTIWNRSRHRRHRRRMRLIEPFAVPYSTRRSYRLRSTTFRLLRRWFRTCVVSTSIQIKILSDYFLPCVYFNFRVCIIIHPDTRVA